MLAVRSTVGTGGGVGAGVGLGAGVGGGVGVEAGLGAGTNGATGEEPPPPQVTAHMRLTATTTCEDTAGRIFNARSSGRRGRPARGHVAGC